MADDDPRADDDDPVPRATRRPTPLLRPMAAEFRWHAPYIAHVLRFDIDGQQASAFGAGVPLEPVTASKAAPLTPENAQLFACMDHLTSPELTLPKLLSMVPHALPAAIHPLAAHAAYLLSAYNRARECCDLSSVPYVRGRANLLGVHCCSFALAHSPPSPRTPLPLVHCSSSST